MYIGQDHWAALGQALPPAAHAVASGALRAHAVETPHELEQGVGHGRKHPHVFRGWQITDSSLASMASRELARARSWLTRAPVSYVCWRTSGLFP
jgi:hypothetical protein